MSFVIMALLLVLGAGLSLGAQSLPAGLDPRLVAVSNGPSGLKWIGGNRENQLMHPGLNCIACHSAGEGPRLTIAGTVFTKLDEKDDDFGVEGATVQITDAKGQVIKLVTNKAGNFLAGRNVTLAVPITAMVIYKGKEHAMGSPQSIGNCAICHTAKGAGGAPGRITIP
jgi:NOL1/NOP2/fmu family ribosome biogenesis protein